MNTHSAPPTLRTATPTEGLELARQLATLALSSTPAKSMAEHLKTNAATCSSHLLAAVYFQAIATANHGWRA